MLGVASQLPAQELHQITCRVQAPHQVIQEDLIGSVHLEKVQFLRGRLHTHHPPLLQVSHSVEVDRQRLKGEYKIYL